MPIKYQIDRSLVRIELSDPFDRDQILETVHRLLSDPALRPGLGFISDHSKLDFTATTDLVKHVLAVLAELAERLGPFRCAVVVSSDASFGMARMSEMLADNTHVQVRGFRSLEEAEAWSKAPPAA